MEEIKRRTLVVRIFPNAAACLRLVRALAVETHEAMQYFNMEPLREQQKDALASWEMRRDWTIPRGKVNPKWYMLGCRPRCSPRHSVSFRRRPRPILLDNLT